MMLGCTPSVASLLDFWCNSKDVDWWGMLGDGVPLEYWGGGSDMPLPPTPCTYWVFLGKYLP